MTASSSHPASPDATGELREALLGPVRDWQERHRQGSFVTTPEEFVNAVLALPALRDLRAADAKVQAVRELVPLWNESYEWRNAGGPDVAAHEKHVAQALWIVMDDLRKALDGTTR